MKTLLPSFFKFKTGNDLIRIGSDNDGGYLISEKDVDNSEILISLGISEDWSFEEDFLKMKNIELLAFDGTISEKKFLLFIKSRLRQIYRINNFLSAVKLYLSYKKFFEGKRKHFEKNVSSGVKNNPNFITMKEIFQLTPLNNIFLKIDIEGWEYRILEDILDNQERLSCLVIEFHDCDLHLDRIKNFIKTFSLNLIHIHANNYSEISTKDNLPLVMELTFSKNSECLDSSVLPHPLDQPNNKNADDIFLTV